MDKVRLAFCGTGTMGQAAHLRNYAQLGGECTVVALADAVPGKAAAVAARYGVAHAYASDADLLARHAGEIDAIVAIGSFGLHGRALPRIIDAGKPMLIEKPLASSAPVARALIDRLGDGGARCMVAYHKRSDPATEWAKAEIDRLKASGELGALRLVKALMPPGDWTAGAFGDLVGVDGAPDPVLEPDPRDPDYDDDAQAAYTTFVNYYIHQVNLLRHLLGEDYHFEYAGANGVLAAGTSASGAACLLEMGAFAESRGWREEATACFDRGFVRLALPAPMALHRAGTVEVFADPAGGEPSTRSPGLPNEHAMMRQAKNFLRFVRGEAPAPADAAEALKDLEQAKEYLALRPAAR